MNFSITYCDFIVRILNLLNILRLKQYKNASLYSQQNSINVFEMHFAINAKNVFIIGVSGDLACTLFYSITFMNH